MLSYMIKTQQLKVFSNPHLSAQTVLTSRTKGRGCLLHLLYHKHYVHNQNLKIAILLIYMCDRNLLTGLKSTEGVKL